MTNERPDNDCGGCTACCVVMPVVSEDFCKPSGTPCRHLCPGGCGIYPDRPEVCRSWLCLWRKDGWLGSRPEYRPDKLGVMFSTGDGNLAIWEVNPGALGDPRVDYIKTRLKNRYKAPEAGVNRYPLGILDVSPTPEMIDQVNEGVIELHSTARWKSLGGNEYILEDER